MHNTKTFTMRSILSIITMLLALSLPCCSLANTQNMLSNKECPVWANIDGLPIMRPLIHKIYQHWTQANELETARTMGRNTFATAYEKLYMYSLSKKHSNADAVLIFAPKLMGEYFSDHELSFAELEKNFEFVPIAYDALVFLANAHNPITELSSANLRGIYSGTIHNWKELGGNDIRIDAFQRPWYSLSQKVANNLFMHQSLFTDSPMIHIKTDEEDVTVFAPYNNTDESIGYTMYYYARDMFGKNRVKLLAIDGVKPDADTIASGLYPFQLNYYMIFPENLPASHPIRLLVSWVLSPVGQTIVSSAGLIPINASACVKNDDNDSSVDHNIRLSSGTGGSTIRAGEDFVYEKTIHERSKLSYPTEQHAAYTDFDFDFLGRFTNVNHIISWRQSAKRELQQALKSQIGDNAPIEEYVFLYHNLLSVYMVGGCGIDTQVRTAVFDLVLNKELVLSDVFYNGVDYGDYIDVSLLQRSFREGEEALGLFSFEEDYLKKSFSGLPSDYPYYIIDQNGALCIVFDGDNLWIQVPDNDRAFLAEIPLTAEVSPWGK